MSAQTNQPPEELESFDGERGMPSVNDSGPSTAKRGLIVAVLVVVVGLGGGAAIWKYKQRANREANAKEAQSLQLTSAVPARTFTEPPPPAEPPPLPGDVAAPGAERPVQPVVPAANGQQQHQPATAARAAPGDYAGGPGAPGQPERPVPTVDKSTSGLMAMEPKGSDTAGKGSGQSSLAAAPGGNGILAALLSSTTTQSRSARHLGNRNFMLAKGSFIDCSLQTNLDSTVPGMTACVVTRNIYSDNGKVLLVERGSTITGEYQSNMRQGMARIFVLWSRIKTPNGIVIDLDSPGTDPLGGAGLPGYIDNHFWQRFGGALMLSLVDDVARYATQQNGTNNGQINFSNTGEASQNMAAEALKNTINIPPTLNKNQGEQVGVYVARDLDFSSVYDVAATNK